MTDTAPVPTPELEERTVNVIRGLVMDAVQAANSGHPGTGMALAPLAHVLYNRVMNHDSSRPDWFDRDRLVLSAGHASSLLYALLYLEGYGLELDDIKAFRQVGAKTPGHPERGHTAGVEVTTGPLGQGVANAVGMAVAEANLRARFGAGVSDHFTFCIAGDGCLMEGISHEAASLAGHLGLGKLILIYDDNHITIDGPTEMALSDDPSMRFHSYGWDVQEAGEIANDLDALEGVLRAAMAVTDKPSLIRLRTHIGFPSPKFMDTPKAHGNPLGAEEISAVKAILGMPDASFVVPEEVLAYCRSAGRRGAPAVKAWQERFDASPDARRLRTMIDGGLEFAWDENLPVYSVGMSVATREASGECLNAIVESVPGLIGGGADLTGNTGTAIKGSTQFTRETPHGRQINFGVREHAMGGVLNGIAAHGGLLPFGGTFFVFSDYMRGAVRVGALSRLKVIHSWTHDSLGVGEDGPTHQPIEHLPSLRAMPGLRLLRPADGNETAAAWRVALKAAEGPTALVLSRQKLPILRGTSSRAGAGVALGAYVLQDPPGDGGPDIVLVGSGSEVQLCVEAAKVLASEGHRPQVVSMPSWDLFDTQDEDYIDTVFPPEVPVIACEAASSFGWERWADLAITVDTWGASGPAERLFEEFGFSADSLVEAAHLLLDE